MYNKLLYSSHSQTHHNEEGFYLQNKCGNVGRKKKIDKNEFKTSGER